VKLTVEKLPQTGIYEGLTNNNKRAARTCSARPHEPKIVTQLMAKDSGTKGGKRILLVDDDAEIIESLRLALEGNGYTVLIARDGNQGLALSERENPDLVILDMMMPKRSGFLVLEKMRRTRETPLRVIMITANEGSRHKAYAEMLGVDDYIRKPFPMDRLIESVSRLIG
jgi:CheY-like chemotaxis protein